MAWVEEGERVEVTKRGHVVAMLQPPLPFKPRPAKRPDFAARLKRIYGNKVLSSTGADIVAYDRGER